MENLYRKTEMRCLLIGRPSSPFHRIERLLMNFGWQVTVYEPDQTLSWTEDDIFTCDVAIMDGAGDDLNGRLHRVRGIASNPIIFILGEFSVEERTRALTAGADDFLHWAVSGELLMSRLHALLRLRSNLFQSFYRLGNLEVDVEHRRVRWAGEEIAVSQREFQILTLLAQNANTTITRSELLERVWKNDAMTEMNALDVHISRLRRKLINITRFRFIETIRGVGYRLTYQP
jgi:two-component system copper resistance phosphate regulon response regulator CusR